MFEQIDGVKVFYEIRGEKGLPVVLLHGWGCSSALMNPVAEALGQDHRVLVIDFPGFGQSQVPHSAWGVPEYAACLKKLLEQICTFLHLSTDMIHTEKNIHLVFEKLAEFFLKFFILHGRTLCEKKYYYSSYYDTLRKTKEELIAENLITDMELGKIY